MNELHVRPPEQVQPAGAVRDASFRFDSPKSSVQTADSGVLLRFADRREVVPSVARALSPRARSSRDRFVVAGAVPFDQTRLPQLRLHALKALRDRPEQALGTQRFVVPAPREIAMQPSPEAFVDAVARAVQRIQSDALRKVVLSRALDLTLSRPLDLEALRDRLATQNPSAFVFSCDVSQPGMAERRTLVGASPELLVAKRGAEVTSHPLAGSLPRSADATEDRARAERLRGSIRTSTSMRW